VLFYIVQIFAAKFGFPPQVNT